MSLPFVKLHFFLAAAACAALSLTTTFAAEENAQSLDQILAAAQKDKKPVVLEFTGSDWCPPCKMMKKEVFSKPAFESFAKNEIHFVTLDFPKSRPQSDAIKSRNRELAEKFNVEGFPTLVVLDPTGKELGRQVGFMGGGAEAVISWIKSKANL